MVSWTNPTVGGDTDAWGTELNTILDTIKTALNAVPATPSFTSLPPTGLTYETIPRILTSTTNSQTTGDLRLTAIYLPSGTVVSKIAFVSGGTAATSPTHWWFGLYDSSRVQLALTADQTTTAWAASTMKTLNIATIASGASSTFTTTYSGLHYVGLMVAASTPPSIYAFSGGGAQIMAQAPTLCGPTDSLQSTPPAFPHTAASFGSSQVPLYAAVG